MQCRFEAAGRREWKIALQCCDSGAPALQRPPPSSLQRGLSVHQLFLRPLPSLYCPFALCFRPRCPLSLRSAALAPDQHVVKKHLPACPPFPTALRPPALSQALDVCFQKKHLPHRAKNQHPAVRSVPPASVQAAAPSLPNSH